MLAGGELRILIATLGWEGKVDTSCLEHISMLVVHATVRIASLEVLSWKDIRKPKYLHIHP
ncbi:MAG: hypothetical protein ACK56I_08230, partial [bacterium]